VKLLVNTSVSSLALHRKGAGSLSPDEKKLKAELVQAIQDGRVAMLGLVRQELLSGIKEKAQFDKVKTAVDADLGEPIHTGDHEYAARIHNECLNHGIEAGTVDILICALAVRRSGEVLSSDDGLNRCLVVAKRFHERQKKNAAIEEAKPRRTFRTS